MKKENKKIAQQRRAEERARKETLQKVKKWLPVILLAIVILGLGIWTVVTSGGKTTTGTGSSESEKESTADNSVISEPIIKLDESLTYYATIEIADYGTIKVELNEEEAPVTVANFVNLAQSGFYDGLTFHRIIEGFMMQGGDPEGTGSGGSDKKIIGEFAANGYDNQLSHTRGAISMARSNAYNSARSQFFIVHQDYPSLDGKYAVFGYVTEGMDVVDAICEAAEPVNNNGKILAENQPVITSIKITTAAS